MHEVSIQLRCMHIMATIFILAVPNIYKPSCVEKCHLIIHNQCGGNTISLQIYPLMKYFFICPYDQFSERPGGYNYDCTNSNTISITTSALSIAKELARDPGSIGFHI